MRDSNLSQTLRTKSTFPPFLYYYVGFFKKIFFFLVISMYSLGNVKNFFLKKKKLGTLKFKVLSVPNFNNTAVQKKFQ